MIYSFATFISEKGKERVKEQKQKVWRIEKNIGEKYRTRKSSITLYIEILI